MIDNKFTPFLKRGCTFALWYMFRDKKYKFQPLQQALGAPICTRIHKLRPYHPKSIITKTPFSFFLHHTCIHSASHTNFRIKNYVWKNKVKILGFSKVVQLFIFVISSSCYVPEKFNNYSRFANSKIHLCRSFFPKCHFFAQRKLRNTCTSW